MEMGNDEVRSKLRELIEHLKTTTDVKPSKLFKFIEALEIAIDMSNHIDEEMGQAHDFERHIAGDRR